MSSTRESPSLSATKQALLRIRELKQQLAEAERARDEPIAIVSMACRFPRHSDSPESFWQSLLEGRDEVTELPPDRWDLDAYFDADPDAPGKMYARRGAFLDNIDGMDADFFGISPREATWIDPQQRLFLEVSWEALERAGWTSDALDVDTGVFVGWMHNDYQNECSDSLLALNPYIATGSAGSFLCGRLSYYLGVQGPSLAVDTACSSSLVALHLACQSLRHEECERAIVGGVNVMTSPKTTVMTCKLHALSPQGHSRAFDASADGYLRGEGCGVVTLKRLSDARRDGDPILAVIRGSALTHNGFSSGLTAPNPESQKRAIEAALKAAGIAPTDVDYLEAHGTGTELGDPLEMQAAAAVLGDGRDPRQPLLVGSVKTNIGHLEAAAGMAGLIKVILAIQHGRIPPHLNFETPNPHINWDELPVKIVTDTTDWPDAERRIAGVSAFGMSGTNAHVVVEAPSQPSPSGNGAQNDEPAARRPVEGTNGTPGAARGQDAAEAAGGEAAAAPVNLFVVSGKSEAAVEQLAGRYAEWAAGHPAAVLADACWTSGNGRRHFEWRAAITPQSLDHAQTLLASLATGAASADIVRGQARAKPVVAWQFTGQGSQYVGMGRQLYDTQPIFREILDRCDTLLGRLREGSLLDVMFQDEERLNETTWTQPAIFCFQVALAELMKSWDMHPDVVLGHSLGQYSAACVAGMLDWEDGLALIHERSRLTGGLPAGGAMAAVFAGGDRVQSTVDAHAGLSVAAYNGSHTVISGPAAAVAAASQALSEQGIRCQGLKTSHAFHSALLDPVLDDFQAVADALRFGSGNCPLICNVTGEVVPVDQVLDGAYWRRQLREPVQYAASVQAAAAMGCDVMVELGPQPFLTGMAAACWPGSASALIPSLQKDQDDGRAIANTLARLYTQGVSFSFRALQGARRPRPVLLPTYPFQRKRFWGPARPGAANVARDTTHPLLGEKRLLAGVSNEQRFEKWVAADQPAWLQDHAVFGDVVFPGAAYVEMAVASLGGRGTLENLAFEVPLQLQQRTCLQSILRTGDERTTIEIHSLAEGATQWTRNCSTTVGAVPQTVIAGEDRAAVEARCDQSIDVAEFYELFYSLGLRYGPQFQVIESLQYGDADVLARLKLAGDQRGYVIPPMLLDGAFQSLAVGLFRDPESSLFLPVGMERVECLGPVGDEVWSHAAWRDADGDLRTADVTLFDDRGTVLARIEKLKLRAVSRAALRQMSGSGPERLLYSVEWRQDRLPEATTRPGRWLIVSEPQADDADLAGQLEARGQLCSRVALMAGDGALAEGDARTPLVAADEAAWNHHLEGLSAGPDGGLSGVVWLVSGQSREATIDQRFDQVETHCTAVLSLLHGLRDLKIEWLERGLQLVTECGVDVTGHESVSSQASQFWGFGRVIGTEHPALRCRVVDLDDPVAQAARLVDVLLTDSRESQVALRGENTLVPRLTPLRAKPEPTPVPADKEGTYLITGGLGMLGRRAAEWLANRDAGHIVLVSRRPPSESTQAMIEAIEERGSRVYVKQADIGDQASMGRLIAEIKAELPPIKGVIHAAGVLSDGLLAEQSWDSFRQVLTPKEAGAWMLHELTLDEPLDFFILYSSVASILGSPGQANYAMANSFLDGLAHARHSAGLPALSINWGPWNEGMAATENVAKGLARQGMTPLSAEEAHEAMERLLANGTTQATVLDVDWGRMRQRLPVQAPPMLDTVWPDGSGLANGETVLLDKLREVQGSARREVVVAHVQAELQQILSTPQPPEPDANLADLGLDSLMAVELSTHLQQQVGSDYAIPPTIAFDYPSVGSLSDHLLELLKDTSDEVEVAVVQKESSDEFVAIIGVGCRFPGARGIDEYWRLLREGIDATSEIPADRWNLDEYYDPEPQPGKMYTRRGGFLDGIDEFDAPFFGISDEEARWTDPQHRLLLETTWEALEDAGIAPHQMEDPFVGVFMGLMSTDYAQLHERTGRSIDGFQGAGFSHSAGVGRISYLFGFEGPSMAVDSASSSSLVAVCQAVNSLMEHECNLAVAGGVNAILTPTNSLLLSQAGMLSPDGRCKSFSAAADGFGRGEGCGVVLLKRLSEAQRDGDRVLAVIRGTSMTHNGNNGALTAPSGRSQERLLRQAVAAAGLSPSDVQYLEAHGTGTELGDPIELRAAATVLGKGRSAAHPLLVGSAKANIGHLEAAGGVSGLIKVVLAMQHDVIPRQIHFDQPSPHIPWKQLRARIVTEETSWPNPERKIAGVTALGMTGTNAHLVLESGPARSRSAAGDLAERPVHLLPLSAKTPVALQRLAQRYLGWLEASPEVDLADMCYTAAIGRRHLEQRAALVVSSVAEASSALARLAAGEADSGVVQARSQSSTRLSWLFGASGREYSGIGRQLYATEPVFRAAVDQCVEASQSVRSTSLLEAFADGDGGALADPLWAEPALFAVQMGLAQLWTNWGIEPDVVFGCGVGQYAAACAAGVMTWEDGFKLALQRGTLAHQSPSGLRDVDDGALDAFETTADSLDYFPADRPLICSLTGKVVPVHQVLGGNYWRRQLQSALPVEVAAQSLADAGSDLLVEMGPAGSLPEDLAEPLSRSSARLLSGLTPHLQEVQTVLNALAEIHCRGTRVDFRAFHQPWQRSKLKLPTYPFARQQYWLTDV